MGMHACPQTSLHFLPVRALIQSKEFWIIWITRLRHAVTIPLYQALPGFSRDGAIGIWKHIRTVRIFTAHFGIIVLVFCAGVKLGIDQHRQRSLKLKRKLYIFRKFFSFLVLSCNNVWIHLKACAEIFIAVVGQNPHEIWKCFEKLGLTKYAHPINAPFPYTDRPSFNKEAWST